MTNTRRFRWGSVVALAMAGLLAASPALGLDDIRDRIREVEEREQRAQEDREASEERQEELSVELEHTSVELQAADKRLRETTAKVDRARIDLTIAEDELAAAEAAEVRIEGELEVAYANEAKIESSLADNAAAQEQTRLAVGSIARESYKSGGLGHLGVTLELLAGEGDTVQEMSMARTVMRVQDSQIQRLGTILAEETAEQDRLAGVRRDIALLLAEAEATTIRKQEARDGAEQAKKDLEALEAQQARDKKALQQEYGKLEKHLAAEEAEAEALEKDLTKLAEQKYGLKQDEKAEKARLAEEARLKREAEERARKEREAEERRKREEAEEERRRAAEEREARYKDDPAPPPSEDPPAPPPPAPEPPPPSAGIIDWPVNAPVTSEYGWRVHPILGYAKLHAGMDFGSGCGAPVYAAESGTIIATTYNSIAGNKVILDHGVIDGVNLVTTYHHLQSFARGTGSVSRGELVGYSGTTGGSTACHLHFETHENGNKVNPRNWL
ncbi:M23 family metallopeptidase [Ornithinimicrobium cavernae]|uniref:M23 family metallopeptidase n=1 Tax=Ornithinimicrobium cavernae TaxID=2666047 RepID=UPI0012B17954|nr:M23 family metallopeptidase [Ornithinimicrobium cavernae]